MNNFILGVAMLLFAAGIIALIGLTMELVGAAHRCG